MERRKTRFAPSPTGWLHVGGARTALFNMILARQGGGKFLLRIEDTDRVRHDESAVDKILEDLRWLGIDWDEGFAVGGPDEPYRQSERLEIYDRHIDKLVEAGSAYYAFDTAEELDAQRRRARQAGRTFHYRRPGSFPSPEQVAQARREGKPVVVRFCTPARDVTIRDDAFGEVTIPSDQMEDFIIRKADGFPTYHLANVVDDALMGVNYVCRGQEFLGQTWRQVLLREALGLPEPGYCHLPLILDMEGRKLSKRDGAVEVHAFRAAGYMPEVLVNFIALLGWRPAGDREKLSMDELVELFSVDRIGKANAKFDRDKLLAFNTDALAAADEDRLVEAFHDFLTLNETVIPTGDEQLLRRLLRACRGLRTFRDVVDKCEVLFAADEAVQYDPKAVKKVLARKDGEGVAVLAELRDKLREVSWELEALKGLIEEYCRRKHLGMGRVAQPLRVAVTGSTVSPSIYDTLLLLGRDRALSRIERCLAVCRS